jgi:hypothetical protein
MAARLEVEVAVLEQARARLEALLEADENWRALVHRPATAGEEDAARRARDARLEMALAGNVVYQAWRHVGEAIAAVRKGETPAPPAQIAEVEGSASELPSDIAELIRTRSAEEARRAQPVPPAPLTVEARGGEAGADAPDGVETELSEQEEASVEFVTLEPVPAAGAERTGERRPPLRQRLRELATKPEPQTRAFAPSQAPQQEADVTILTADAIRERKAAEERAGAIGRFRKALLGE